MILEGPILMIASGFFLKLGFFSLIPLYCVLVIGDLVADIGWYYVGYYFAEPIFKKQGRFFGVTPEIFEKMKKLVHDHQTKILLGSKVTIGFGLAIATVISAGAARVPIRKYILLNTIGEIFLAATLLTIGYFFGQFYSSIFDGFKIIFLVAGIVFGGVVIFGFSRYIKSRALKF
jgi:membrane protein DedA with SNARE-associated domain